MITSNPHFAVASSSSLRPVSVQRLPPTSAYSVPTHQLAETIEGRHTQVVIQEYHDRTFVIVTQLERVGVVMQASLPADTPYIQFSSSSADFEDDDEDRETQNSPNGLPTTPGTSSSPSSNSQSTSFQNLLPTLLNPLLVQTSLLGTPPPTQTSLYSLYLSCIHTLLRCPSSSLSPSSSSSATSSIRNEEQEGQKDLRPVVLGLGLALGSQGVVADEEEGQVEFMAQEEGERFRAVLDLVRRCRLVG